MSIFDLSLEDKLYRVKYEIDPDHPHIRVRDEVCRICSQKVCTFICPAGVYKVYPEDPSRIKVNHENCLECGTCYRACPLDGIVWGFPNGGMGVRYRFG